MNCSTPGLAVHHQLPEFTCTLLSATITCKEFRIEKYTRLNELDNCPKYLFCFNDRGRLL